MPYARRDRPTLARSVSVATAILGQVVGNVNQDRADKTATDRHEFPLPWALQASAWPYRGSRKITE